VTQPVDNSILHEIVRIIESRRKVPGKVIVKSKEYLLTYLEDHQRRLEEALQRYDADRLNMLYGQLASKIKYQLLRRVPARIAGDGGRPAKKGAKAAPAKGAASSAKKKVPAKSKRTAAARKRPAAKRRGAATGRQAGKKHRK
jgi:hypothetical protein